MTPARILPKTEPDYEDRVAATCYRCETPVNDGRWVVDRHGHCVHRGTCPPTYPRDRLVASE